MASITFAAGTVIPSTWLNDVNAIVYGSASPPANPIRVDSNGNVGVGVTPSSYRLDVKEGASPTTTPTGRFGTYRSLYLQPGTGSAAILGPVIGFGAYVDSTAGNYIQPASILMQGGALIAGPYGGGLEFYTYSAGAETGTTQTLASTLRMSLDSNGNFLLTSTGGLGYGTGSGGTVTQATSKSTGVTLNKTNGQITMNNAALGAGTSVTFTVTNSTVAVTDVVCINAAGNGNYRVECASVSGGSFIVRVTNVTAGSLSDALGINFAVIKATTS